MKTDIIKRLRKLARRAHIISNDAKLLNDAADEIEKLRGRLAACDGALCAMDDYAREKFDDRRI